MNGKSISLHAFGVEVVYQLLLALRVTSQVLNRAVTMGANALSSINERLNLWVAEGGMQTRRLQLFGRHRGNNVIEYVLSFGHKQP